MFVTTDKIVNSSRGNILFFFIDRMGSKVGAIAASRDTREGFHGTDIHSANNIMDVGFEIRNRENSFLGPGVYFYEASARQAKKWALGAIDRKKLRCDYAVIRSYIALGKCFTVDIPECKEIIELIEQELRKTGKLINLPITLGVIANRYKLDTITGVNVRDSGRAFVGDTITGFKKDTERMICVKNLACIVDREIYDTGRY